jgi:hypothetical protein
LKPEMAHRHVLAGLQQFPGDDAGASLKHLIGDLGLRAVVEFPR